MAVKPNHSGDKVQLTLEVMTRSGWAVVGHAAPTLNRKSRTSVILHYTNTSIIGRDFREQATFPGDAHNATKTTTWAHFKITK